MSRPLKRVARKSKQSLPDDVPWFANETLLRSVHSLVVKWFERHQRPLPWRCPPQPTKNMPAVTTSPSAAACRDPYGTWVCEIMSQQTRIQTVESYWPRWMAAFPTVADLAKADAAAVRALWTGLGFYRRAQMLHRGAQYVVEQHSGVIPSTAAELQNVPGIGPYTAGAIASLCFGEYVPAVDGNVIRVLSRLGGVRDVDPKSPKDTKRVWEWARSVVDVLKRDRPALSASGCKAPFVFNEALIELGATVCRPNGSPQCGSCPLAAVCRANAMQAAGDIESIDGTIPMRGSKIATIASQHVCAVVHCVRDADTGTLTHIVLAKRAEHGLLASMFEVPNLPVVARDAPLQQHCTEVSALGRLIGLGASPQKQKASTCAAVRLPCFVHKFSHIHQTVYPYLVLHANVGALNTLVASRAGETLGTTRDVRVIATADMEQHGVAKTVFKMIALVNRQQKVSTASRCRAASATVQRTKRSRSA